MAVEDAAVVLNERDKARAEALGWSALTLGEALLESQQDGRCRHDRSVSWCVSRYNLAHASGNQRLVAPYNAQVKRLQVALGPDARVGSVDRFQGQEAPIVFLSLCSSDAAESPYGMQVVGLETARDH